MNILITGKGSYIGTSFEKWMKRMYGEECNIVTLDMHTDNWKSVDFSIFQTVLHIAGIAHRKDANKELYERINHQLAVNVFKKCIDDNVPQFIFMSSGAVYSQNDTKHNKIVINKKTATVPCTDYGKSKLQAEIDILKLAESKITKVVILRPPTVYGYNSKGNYNPLSNFAKKTVVFPMITNKRSMIHIDNLCEFIRLAVKYEIEGTYLPQNREYVSICDMVELIGRLHNRKIIFSKILNPFVYIACKYINKFNKIFGTFYYDHDEFDYFDGKYQVVDFKESLVLSEFGRKVE